MPCSHLHIVIADDDILVLDLVRHALRCELFEVTAVRDGESAVRAAQTRRPSLVILDASMPGMDGFSALAALKADPVTKAIPVLMLTSRRGPGDVKRAMALGAGGYIAKPFQTRVLLARVHAALGRPQDLTPRSADIQATHVETSLSTSEYID